MSYFFSTILKKRPDLTAVKLCYNPALLCCSSLSSRSQPTRPTNIRGPYRLNTNYSSFLPGGRGYKGPYRRLSGESSPSHFVWILDAVIS
jgi:hypothetical protein